ncbi:MAG: nuclear transport factor 2 family protein [Parasphingopyxis sp.]|uniref:nuclear transport factor 2 family protein n=1 Tax=Parasphingopyxis sp. TaxID=1920299 RepID=UPI003FA0B408
MASYANTIETVIAKQDIRDVVMRYARGVDRADGELLKSCYWEDAIEEHGSTYSGPAHPYIDEAVPRMQKTGVMGHYVCNSHVELDGDMAYAESYVITFARFEKDGEPWDTLTGGRIVDRMERRDGEWKIAHRRIALDWNRDEPANETWCLGLFDPDHPQMVLGKKAPADFSYERF